MKLTMLGTRNAIVTECYNTCFVLSDEDQHFLIDGGGGNTLLYQLKHVGINWKDIHHIFVTHKHIDHLLGIIWMIRLICQGMCRNMYDGEVNIYGHEEVISILEDMSMQLFNEKETSFISKRLHFVIVYDKETKMILSKKVTFFDIHSTKDKQFGFCMNLGNNQKLTCCGDEPYNEYEKEYVEGCTWLLHEAFCLYSEKDIFKPYEKHHSTVKDACCLAQEMNVKNIVLYHTEDKNIKNRKELYINEGKQYYKGNIYVPNDLEEIELR